MLVEGYTDVIALRQAGVPETVCSMGTALTDDQVDALRRLAPSVLLCQDPDAAGQEAVGGKDAIRAFNEAHALRGSRLRVVRLPAGPRPGRRRRSRTGRRRCARCSRPSVPVARFEVERALERGDLATPEGRDRALRAVAPVIERLEPGAAAGRPDPARVEPAADARRP